MATVTGLTAARMLLIEAASIVSGAIVGNDLILTKFSGATINAGVVRGPQGIQGVPGTNGTNAPIPKLYTSISTVTTSLTNATITIVTGWALSAALSSSGVSSMVTIASNGDHTINESGLYTISYTVSFASNATGRRIAFMHLNGVECRRQDVGSGAQTTVEVVHSQPFVAGDIITFRAYQSSGAALALNGAPDHIANILKHA